MHKISQHRYKFKGEKYYASHKKLRNSTLKTKEGGGEDGKSGGETKARSGLSGLVEPVCPKDLENWFTFNAMPLEFLVL